VEAAVRGTTVALPRAMDEAKNLFASVPKQAIAFVLSAAHSLEDNWAMHQLGAVLVDGAALYASGHPDGYEDSILIHRDKNPNTRGVKQLAPGARSMQAFAEDVAAGRITHAIALGGAAPLAAETLRGVTLLTVAAHEGPLVEAAAVVLPATSWAEHSGTYVNAKGMRQVSDKALEPLGASRPAWQHVADLASALGFHASWSKLKQIRAELMGSSAPDAAGASPSAAAAP
jgi:NADH dehydrogenase/NADH:ubiquinone oxidoreductase subunit G